MSVSVIVSSYNQKEYLRKAIESVLAQTVRPHEILVVDANSSDGSQEMITEYESEYPDLIRPLLLDNDPGIPKMRNYALKRVEGEYVSILDGDDLFLPEKIKREVEMFETNPETTAVYSNVHVINEDGSRVSQFYAASQPSGKGIFPDVFSGQFGMLRSMTIEYEKFKQLGFLDPEFWHYDGFEFTVRLSKNNHISYIHEPLAEYRRYEDSPASWRTASDKLPELREIYKKHRAGLMDFPPSQRDSVVKEWEARLALLEARVAVDDSDYFRALRKYVETILTDRSKVVNITRILNVILPKPIYNIVRRIYWRYQRYSY